MDGATISIKLSPTLDDAAFKKVIDDLANIKINPNMSVDEIDKSIEGILTQYSKIEAAIESRPIDLNFDSKSMDEFTKNIENIGDEIDLSKIEAAFENISDKDLDEMQKKIQEASESFDFRKAEADVKALDADFAKIKTQAQAAFNEQRSVVANLAKAGKTNTDEYKEAQKELEKRRATLKEITDSEKNVGAAIDESNKKMSMIDKLTSIGLVTDGIQSLSNSVVSLTEPFVKLDSASQKIKTLGGAAKDAAPDLREMSVQAAKELPIAPAEHLTATYEALSAGISPAKEQISAFMDAAGKLAVGGNESITNTVNLLSSMVNAYGESATKTGEYSDILFQTVNLGKISVSEMNQSLSQVVPTAAAYGFSMKAVGASLSLMTSNGVPAAQASTMLNQLLIEMQKPGSDLTKVLNGAGVSVESLGKKVKSGDVIGAFKDMDGAFKKAGVSATQAFSSSESGKAFNTLTKDFGKLQEMFDGIDQSAGASDAAFGEMSQSIENRAKLLKSSVDSAFIGFLDHTGVFGEIAMVAGQSLSQLTPIISSLSGFRILFDGFGDVIKKGAVAILNTLVPGLITQTAATGTATGAQYAFNASANLNPYIIGAVAIAGAVALIWKLASALSDSTEKQLENNKAAQESAKAQVDATNGKIKTIQANDNLIASFEALANKQNRSKEENDQLRDMQLKLAQAYPGTIKANEDFSVSLAKMKNQASANKGELGKLGSDLEKFQNQANNLQLQEKTLNIKVEQEKVEDNADDSLQKSYIKQYASALNAAKNSDEVKKAQYEVKMAMINSDGWKDMDAEQQKAVLKGIDNMAKGATEKAELAAKQSTDIMNNAINSIATNEGYNTTVEQIAAKSKKSATEVSQALITNGAIQINNGKNADAIYTKLASTMHKSPEEVKELIDKEQSSKAVTEAHVKSVKDLADAYSKSVSAADENLKQAKNGYLGAQQDYRRAQASGDEELAARSKKTMSEQKKIIIDGVKTVKAAAKDKEALEVATGEKQAKAGKSAIERANEQIELSKKNLDNDKKSYENLIKSNALKENRELTAAEELALEQSNLQVAKEQKEAILQAYEAKKLLVQNADGTIEFNSKIKIKGADKAAIVAALNAADSEIIESQKKTHDLAIKAKVDPNQIDKELLDAQLALEKRYLEINIELGKASYSDVYDYYDKIYDSIAKKRGDLTAKLAAATGDEKNKIEKELLELTNKELDLYKNLADDKKKIGEKQISDLEAQFSAENDAVKAAAEKRESLESTIINSMNDLYNQAADKKKNAALDKLDKQKEAELARIGDNEKAKDRVNQKYSDKRSELEEKYASEQMVVQARIAGEKKSADDAQFIEESQRKLEQLEKLKAIADESGDLAKAAEYQSQLSALNKDITAKGDLLNTTMQTIGSGMNESLAAAISGDAGAAKKAMKKNLGELAGYVKKLLIGKVIEIVLKSDMITGLAAAAGFAAPLVEAGAITLVSAGMNAALNPLINGILSFSTSGLVTEPTLVQVGDGGYQGGENKEWFLRDEHFKAALQEAVKSQQKETADMLAQSIASSQTLAVKIDGKDLYVMLKRVEESEKTRIRT